MTTGAIADGVGKPFFKNGDNPLKRKMVNSGKGSEFTNQKSNKEGYSEAAAKHPGNTIITPAKQKAPKFDGK
jgi:hypothetical protein